MNSNYGKSNTKSGPAHHFDFDLGINSSRSRPLNEQKKPTNSYSSASTYTTSYASKPGGTAATRPSWTHQPAAQSQPGRVGALSGPASMVGDIFGKTWSSSTPAASSVGIGVAKKDPNLFGDLVSSAFGQNKGNSNVPLKNLAPVINKSSFSMGNIADSLPSKGGSTISGGNRGSSESFGSFTNGVSADSGAGVTINSAGSAYKGGNLGGSSLKNMAGNGAGGGKGLNKDPFGSLVDLASKPSGSASLNRGSESSNKNTGPNDAFRDFQEAPKKNSSQSSTSTFSGAFSDFQEAPKKDSSQLSPSTASGASYSYVDDFVFTSSQPSVQSNGVNGFDDLFSSTVGKGSEGVSSQQFSGDVDWGMDSMGGGNDQGGTTELEGLSAPPAGISASSAKNKGMEYHKQGQYADAIQWLSWALVLFEKAGEDNDTIEVLSCRASCYKEIGENKKAVADCSKLLEKDEANISVLVQRALLYESMEKYKLGAEDLRTVMKYDPGNRVARSTIHRLVKMAE